jgi:hypothetical protein
MDIPQGGEGYGALSKGLLRGSPMTTLLTRAPAQSPHTDRTDGCGTHLVCFFEQYNTFNGHFIL